MIIENCPFCQNPETRVYLKDKLGLIRECGCCKGLFNQDRCSELDFGDDNVDASEVSSEYERLISSQSKAVNSRVAKDVIALSLRYFPAAKKILEIGCGTCDIGKVVKDEYPDMTYQGIESSEKFYKAIDPAVKGLVIFEKDLLKALESVPDASQDLIVLSHVVEHLPEPGQVLGLLRRKLLPRGGFYIEVPNEQWKKAQISVRRILKPGSASWFPGHINFFTKESLRNHLEKEGMKIEFLEKIRIADNLTVFKKLLGGERYFQENNPAKLLYLFLKASFLEKLIDYGIILQCVCKKGD